MGPYVLNTLVGGILLGPAAAVSSPVVETYNGYVRGTVTLPRI